MREEGKGSVGKSASGGAWFRRQECERRGMVPYARVREEGHGSVCKSLTYGTKNYYSDESKMYNKMYNV